MADTTLSPDAPATELPATDLPGGQTVTAVKHWSDQLFSFRLTRPASLRFRSGEFVMIGLMGENGRPLLRAYSIASPFWDEELEFYSIKVPDGPLTSRLQNIKIGDQVIVKTKPTGTLILDALLPGKRLFLISTGTGIAPFAALIRDPGVYEAYDQVILTHTCRKKEELAYGFDLVEQTKADPLVGEEATEKLLHYATTTREPSQYEGRITDLMRSGKVYEDLGTPPLTGDDRVMICGSMALNLDVKDICAAVGLDEGSVARPGQFVVEKSFVGDDTRLS
ncbi:MAG: ferredoxin--NADP(+) reductase [Hyphomicrobiales bacterium]|nr:MAG: ferredoxin--NADP(+) reductase [Hyphomicrobiales bacterium]